MDRDLLQDVYRMYYDELFLYLYSFLRNRAEAEDLIQEVFLKAMLSLEDTHQNFRAWLYRVGRNLCINHLKRRQREVPEGDGQRADGQAAGRLAAGRQAAGGWAVDGWAESGAEDSPLPQLLKKERNRRLYQAILGLPELQRQVVLLQYFSGLSQKEIGEVLEMSPGNVRIVAHRARRELRRLLEVEGYEFSGDV